MRKGGAAVSTTFYLDLDRTLFRTERASEIYDAIKKVYPDSAAMRAGYDKRADYYVFPHKKDGDSVTYYHDMVSQLRAANLDYQQVFNAICSELSDGRLEYSGLEEFIRLLKQRGAIKILTYGEDRYQRFKASLCPSLAGIEIITLIGSKSEYLNTHALPGDWIIDDKRIEGLKPGIRMVQILHDSRVAADVRSLADAGKIVVNIDF